MFDAIASEMGGRVAALDAMIRSWLHRHRKKVPMSKIERGDVRLRVRVDRDLLRRLDDVVGVSKRGDYLRDIIYEGTQRSSFASQ